MTFGLGIQRSIQLSYGDLGTGHSLDAMRETETQPPRLQRDPRIECPITGGGTIRFAVETSGLQRGAVGSLAEAEDEFRETRRDEPSVR